MAHSNANMLTVIPYNPSLDDQWDSFIKDNSRNGCIFHERKFLSYHKIGKFEDASLLFLNAGKIVGVLPAAAISACGVHSIVSHPGSSAGGLIYHRKQGLRDVLVMLEKSIHHYRDAGNKSLELRLAEPIFSSPSDAELTFLLWHRGFRLTTREVSSCVDLKAKAAWMEFGRKKNGNDIRRLRNMGVSIVLVDDPDTVYPLIAQSLEGRYGKTPTHSLAELLELKQRYPHRLHCWAALFEGKLIAAVVAFVANDNAVHDFYIAQDYAHARLQVMPLLFHEIFVYYKREGFRWFNFGISSRGDWIKWGILEFKERMGGRATCRDVWLLDDLQTYQACHDKDSHE